MRLFEHAGAGETLMNALTVMSITFAALIALFLLVKALTIALGVFARKKQPQENEMPAPEQGDAFSAGTLVLKDVDEATAAMLMAIVADESGIPPERLVFRSIKLVK